MQVVGGFLVPIDKIKNDSELVKLFCELAEIPSPSLKEEKVIEYVINYCNSNNIKYRLDDYKNIYITIEPTDVEKESILLSAHMDVVGDDSDVNLLLIDDYFIKADGRTLGADDKVGVAVALQFAKELSSMGLKHGGLEIVFTRDEETGMSGIEHVEFEKLNSTYALVGDADKLGELEVSGASYTNANVEVKTLIGGHSGIDIGDETRLNSAKLISELVAELPQGVFYSDETGVITSCNIGAIVAGGVQNAVSALVDDGIKSKDYITEIANRSSTNIINTLAKATYSIRSASVQKEDELKARFSSIVEGFNQKYKGLAEFKIEFEIHLPPFEKVDDDTIARVHTIACEKIGVKNNISSFHAGAETHIYANRTNSFGCKFKPFLLGLADIFGMHSDKEMVDYRTMLKGYEIVKNVFIELNK